MEPQLEAYCALDFSAQGPTAQSLMEQVDNEAAEPEISLSDCVGPVPANLTHNMRSWYESAVLGMRNSALDGIVAHLNSIDQSRHGNPVFYERDLDAAREDNVLAKRKSLADIRTKNGSKYDDLAQLRADEVKARTRFETLRARHNREPKTTNPLIYFPLLLAIGLAEAAINFDAFNSIDFFTPAIATGTTIVIAIALAVSSHYTGTTLKQFKALFGKATDDYERFAAWKMLGIAATTLTTALGAVAFSRFYYLETTSIVNAGFGTQGPSLYQVVGGSMISNVLVWLVGVAFAYIFHDADPAFPVAKDALDKAHSAREKVEKQFEKALHSEFEKHDAVLEKRIKDINGSARSLSSVPEVAAAADMMQLLKAQDARVLAVLSQYRQLLLQRVTPETVFSQKDEIDPDKKITIGRGDYAHMALKLKYL